MSDWNWLGAEADVVIPSVRGVAIYENTAGDIVIRQQGENGEEDSLIIFPKSFAQQVAAAIIAEAE